MAGTDPRFDAAKVAAGFLFAQTMGTPVDETDQPTFYKATQVQLASGDTDGSGAVWDHRATRTIPIVAGVLAVCGVKILETAADQTAAGDQRPVRLELSFTPAEWAKVSDFATMTYYGNWFERGKMLPRQGALFDLQMQRVEVRAFDRKGTSS